MSKLRLIKIICTTLVALLILVAISIFAIIKYIDPNDFKSVISKTVYERTGRELTINGNISWQFFPWIGIKIENVALSNNKAFIGYNHFLAQVSEADINVKILPLLTEKIEVNHLLLKDLNLKLIKNVSGETNWRDLVVTHTNENPATSPAQDSHATTPAKNPEIGFANIAISNASIAWEDRTTNKNIVLSGFNCKGEDVNFDEPFDFSMSFNFASKIPKATGKVALQGQAKLDFAKRIYLFTPLEIVGEVQNTALLRPLPFKIQTTLDIDLVKQSAKLDNLIAQIAQISITGNFAGTSIIDAPIFNGEIAINNCQLIPFLSHYFGIKNQSNDAALLMDSTLQARFEAASKFIKVSTLNAKIDDMEVHGNANFTRFGSKYLGFNLEVNTFDVNRFTDFVFTPAKNAAAKPKNSSKSKGKHNKIKYSKTILIVRTTSNFNAPIKGLTLDGTCKFGRLKIGKVITENASFDISGDNNVIEVHPFKADFYHGILQGAAKFDLRTSIPKISSALTVTRVNIEPLFADLIGLTKITGQGDLQINFNSRGASIDAILKNLHGAGKFTCKDSVWHGVDIGYQINLANSLVNKKTKPTETKLPVTDFGTWSGNFTIMNGVVTNNDLTIQSPHFQATGQGTINLVSQKINYHVEAGDKETQAHHFMVPLIITGTFASPQVYPDMDRLTAKAFGKVIEKAAKLPIEIGSVSIKVSKDMLSKLLKH